MDFNDLSMTALRASAVYMFVLFVIRILGKREVGAITAFDFLVALMIGEVVDEIVFGDVSVAKGFVAIAVVAFWELVNSWSSYKSRFIDRLTGSGPLVLVENGQLKQDNMAKERINREELDSLLRLQGVEKLEEVKKATLEPSGHVSVIKQEWAKPVEKGDLRSAPSGGKV